MNLIIKRKISHKQWQYLCNNYPCSFGFKNNFTEYRKRWKFISWNPEDQLIWIENEDLEGYKLQEYKDFKSFLKAINEQRLEQLL